MSWSLGREEGDVEGQGQPFTHRSFRQFPLLASLEAAAAQSKNVLIPLQAEAMATLTSTFSRVGRQPLESIVDGHTTDSLRKTPRPQTAGVWICRSFFRMGGTAELLEQS